MTSKLGSILKNIRLQAEEAENQDDNQGFEELEAYARAWAKKMAAKNPDVTEDEFYQRIMDGQPSEDDLMKSDDDSDSSDDDDEADESKKTEAAEFEDSAEATEFIEDIYQKMKDSRVQNWARDTDSQHGTKSLAGLKSAIKAWDDFMADLEEADE